MDLSLSAAELEHLGALGVSVAADGSMRSASGREVPAGTVVQLLAKAAVSPAAFQRGYLCEGHAAENASPVSAEGPAARPGPAGPPGPWAVGPPIGR